MSGILSFASGDRFVIRHFLDLGAPQGPVWSNTAECLATADGVLADLGTLASRLLAVYQAMTLESTHFSRYTISTWEPEEPPYNPENFFSADLTSKYGLRSVTDPMDLGICLVIARNAAVGRTGRIWLRGALNEDDVEVDGGRFTLSDPSAMATLLSGAITSSSLGFHFSGGAAPLKVAMIGSSTQGETVWSWAQQVTGLAVKGVSILPVKHKWYNLSA